MSKPSNQRVAYHHLTDRVEMEKTAAREKSDLKKAIQTAKEGKWPDAVKIVTSIGKKHSKDRDFTALVADFTRLAKEHMKDSADQGDFDRHHSKARKGAIRSMEKMLATFGEKKASLTSVETVGALHFINQIQRVAERTAGYKHKEDLKVYTDLDIKVTDGDWNDDVKGPSQPLYNGYVKYKAKVYAVGSGLLGNPTLWENSGSGRIYSDPGGGFYFDPDGGIETGNKGLNQIIWGSLNDAVYRHSGKITRSGSLHLAGWKAGGLDYAIQSGPVLDGGILKIPSQKGLLEIKPGNRKAWFRFTVSLNGKDISKYPSGWSTEDDSAMHTHGRWDVGRKPEALGIQQSLERYSMLKKSQIAKIEAFVYSHDDFRGLKLASTKEAAKKRKAVYVGVMLSDGDKKTLAAWWKKETGSDLLRKSYMHHMTIKFKPSPDEVLALPIGDTVPLKVVGWAADGQAQAVLVQPSGVRSSNSHPHVTVATDGTSPAYSNDLIKSGPVTKVSGPTLKGRVGIFTGKDVQYDLTDTIYEEE